jgi:hypothetical protein
MDDATMLGILSTTCLGVAFYFFVVDYWRL